MRREYMLVYDYEKNGKVYTLPCGNPDWIPDYETAKRIKENKQAKSLYKDRTLYLKIRDVDTPLDLKPNGEYQGKSVYNPDTLWWDAMRPGDLVDEDVANDMIDCMPPKCMRSDCLQMGEPQTSRYDEVKGKWRSTYLTLKKITDGIYEFCGDCFIGENYMHGTEMQYC